MDPTTNPMANPTTHPDGPALATTSMDNFTQRPIGWLWDQRLALGKLAIVAGDPGLGKSFLTLDLAARVSRDGIMPDGFQGPCGDVLLVSAEDDPADTLLPRLRAADAVLSRVHFVNGVQVPRVRRVTTVGSHLPGGGPPRHHVGEASPERVGAFGLMNIGPLARSMARLRPKLIVIDPITAYLGECDSNNNAQVRALLAPLSQLAGEYDCCVLAVSHLNKSPDGATKAMYRTMGSLAFVAASRSAWLVSMDKADPRNRIFAQVKNNLGRSRKAISFRVEDDADGQGRVAWDPTEIDITADDAQDDRARQPMGRPSDAKEQAMAFLRKELFRGSKVRSAVATAAAELGINDYTLNRAAKELGVLKTPNIDRQGNVLWTLPLQTTATVEDDYDQMLEDEATARDPQDDGEPL